MRFALVAPGIFGNMFCFVFQQASEHLEMLALYCLSINHK